jgi:hypothetical protein
MDYSFYESNVELVAVTAFMDVSAAGTGHTSCQPPPYFSKFLWLPADLRNNVYH